MPAVIILRIEDDAHAREIMAVGAKDLALGFLPDAKIHVDRVSICYRTPENEAAAQVGKLDFKQRRDSWANAEVSGPPPVTPESKQSATGGFAAPIC